jgi:HlyD family secretion protein
VNAARLAALAVAIPLFASGCNKAEEALAVYQAVAVETRDISVSVQAAGSIHPDTVVEVKSKASGEILEFRVETGELVQRGTLLARIDRRVPQNRYNQAEAQLDVVNARLRNAEAQFRRSTELYEAKAITEQEFEGASLDLANAKASLVSAQVELETAKIALDDTEVRAPITGTIIAKNVERGAVISSPTSDVGGGTVLMRMADLSLVQVKTYVDETDIGKLKPGLSARVTVEAFPNRPFDGVVLKIEPQGDTIQSVTMFSVLVRIPNSDGLLKPGMNAEVNISVGNATGVLAVPNAALRTERDVASAAFVLGIEDADLQVMLEASRNANAPAGGDTGAKGAPLSETAPAPSREQMMAVFQKQRSGATLTPEEEAIMTAARAAMGGGRGGRGGGNGGSSGQDQMFGGKYVVFTMRNGKPTPVYVQTGITDLDYSQVRSGLTDQDSVLLLPSASMLESQQQLQQRMSRMSGGLPGQSR